MNSKAKMAIIAGAAAALSACASLGSSGSSLANGGTTGPAVQSTTSAPAPVASPDGKFSGACNYNLGSDPVNGTSVATGDITVVNDGNIGIVVTVTITWPQQGYNPLTQTKTGVQVAAGQKQDVQFNYPMTQDQLTNLQNWQSGHGYADGCTYNGTITGTYGSAS